MWAQKTVGTAAILLVAASGVGVSPVLAADLNSYPPLRVNVQTQLPDLPPLSEIRVPTFEEGLVELQNQFGKDSAVIRTSSGDAYVFGGGDSSSSAQILQGLAAKLPSMPPLSTPSLPDPKTALDDHSKQNQQAFSNAVNTNPIPPVSIDKIAPPMPDTSGWSAQQEQAMKDFLASHSSSLGSTGHVPLSESVPYGWEEVFSQGATPFNKEQVLSGLQPPPGWGQGPALKLADMGKQALNGVTDWGKQKWEEAKQGFQDFIQGKNDAKIEQKSVDWLQKIGK